MILITLDIDWAPDFIVRKVDEILKEVLGFALFSPI